MEIAVVGDSKFISGFRLTGIRKIYDTKSNEFEEKVSELLEDEDVGILIIEEKDYKKMSFLLKRRIMGSVMPTVMIIGGSGGDIREKIKKAVGVDLW